MRIYMKDGTIIDFDEKEKNKSWISIDTNKRLIEIRPKESNRSRMIIMMENVNLIDYENSETTGINIKIFPGIK